MKSNDSERPAPEPTAEAIARQQRAARERSTVPPDGYLEFLAQFGDADPEVLRRRRNPSGEPFTL